MSDARLAGLPVPFPWSQKRYQLGHRDFQLELTFQTLHEDFARRRLVAHRRRMGDQEYERQMEGWRRDCGSNVYAFGDKPSWAFLNTNEGMKTYCLLKLQKGEAEGDGEPIEPDEFEALWQDPAFRQELTKLVISTDLNPNPRMPAAGTASPPAGV